MKICTSLLRFVPYNAQIEGPSRNRASLSAVDLLQLLLATHTPLVIYK